MHSTSTSSFMREILQCLSGFLVVLSITVACSTARIHNVPTTKLGSSAPLETREDQIDRAARFQGWTVENLQPGVMIATKRKGQHVASSTIRFDTDSYSIALRDSMNLDQSKDKIHELYNVWVEGLEDSIRREAAAGSSGVSAPGER